MSRPVSQPLRLVVLVALLALSLASIIVLGVLYAQRTDAGEGSPAARADALFSGDDPLQADREQVMSQARQFMLRLNTYGPDQLDESGQMPDYRSSVEEVITPKFKASFEQGVVAAEQTVAQARIARTAQVFSAGVSALDADSARVLVAGSFTNSYPSDQGDRVSDDPAPFRVEVAMVRTGGTWLVDDFVPVTGDDETAPALPDEVPGPSASQAPTPSPATGGKNGRRGNR